MVPSKAIIISINSHNINLHVWSLRTLNDSKSVSNVSLSVVATTAGAIIKVTRSTIERYIMKNAPANSGIPNNAIRICPTWGILPISPKIIPVRIRSAIKNMRYIGDRKAPFHAFLAKRHASLIS